MIRLVFSCCFFAIALQSPCGFAQVQRIPAGDWPAYRRDPQLSGVSPLVGGLAAAPKRHWSVNLGGLATNAEEVWFGDVNGDQVVDLVRRLPDRLICQTLDGRLEWESRTFVEPTIALIHDFAGDGSRGILIRSNTGVEQQHFIVSGKSGKAAFLYSRRNVFGGYERHGKLLPETKGHQLCAWWSGDPVDQFGNAMRSFGYLWSFENGLERPSLRFQTKEVGTIYAPLHLIADMDLDGDLDMVMISHEQIWIYDLESGKKILQTGWYPQIRTYWAAVGAVSLKKGERPSLLMINPMMPGVQVVRLDGGSPKRLWKQVVGDSEDQYQKKVRIGPGAPDPFVDLDGDGKYEIVAQVVNEHDDDQPHIVVFDAHSGKRLFDQPSPLIATVDDLNGDQRPEILFRDADQSWRICHWDGQRFEVLLKTPADLLVRKEPPHRQLSRAVGARSSGRNMPVWRDVDDSKSFLARFKDGVFACTLIGEAKALTLKKMRKVTVHEALGNTQVVKPAYEWNGRELQVAGKTTYTVPVTQVYSPQPPLVGEWNGRRHIIVRNGQGKLLRLNVDGKDSSPLLPNKVANLPGTALVDLDGDGRNELLTQIQREKGPDQVVAVKPDGSKYLELEPPAGATETLLGPTGALGKSLADGKWIVVRYRIKNENTVVVAYSGKTGKQLWKRDHLGPDRKPATTFVLHLPTSAIDHDGDGADDLVASSENWYAVISVKDNRMVANTMTITAAVPGHWGAYATPIVFAPRENAKPLVFHNNAYALSLLTDLSGGPVWHYGLTRDTTHSCKAGFADLNAKPGVEIITGRKDGLLVAYDSAAGTHKCPSCPPGQSLTSHNHGGKIRWKLDLKSAPTDIATADIDGDGADELLLGAGKRLYAVKESNGNGRIFWSAEFPANVLAPILVDLDGDKDIEVLVATSDGQLHCLAP